MLQEAQVRFAMINCTFLDSRQVEEIWKAMAKLREIDNVSSCDEEKSVVQAATS